MKKLMVAFGLVFLTLGLSGCGHTTIAQRVADKTTCEDAGGTYFESRSTWTNKYVSSECELSTKEN